MKEILNTLFEHKTLDKSTAKELLTNLANGEYNSSQVAAFLTVFLMRNITVEELEGFRDAMLDLCLYLDLENELQEVHNKLAALRHAIELAEQI